MAAVLGCHGDPTEAALVAYTRHRSRAEIEASLGAAGVPVAAVADQSDLQLDPISAALWQPVDLPSGVPARVINEPITWNGRRLPIHPAPMWFEHTYEIVVDELGVNPDRFADLVEAGVLW